LLPSWLSLPSGTCLPPFPAPLHITLTPSSPPSVGENHFSSHRDPYCPPLRKTKQRSVPPSPAPISAGETSVVDPPGLLPSGPFFFSAGAPRAFPPPVLLFFSLLRALLLLAHWPPFEVLGCARFKLYDSFPSS